MSVSIAGDGANELGTARARVAPSSILSRLRAETRGEHDAVDQMLDLMNASLTRAAGASQARCKQQLTATYSNNDEAPCMKTFQ